jgi:uncharacterized protein
VAESTPTTWTIFKLKPDGSVATSYAAEEIPALAGWVAARAIWRFNRVDIGYYAFEPGDTLLEYFSLDGYYNAFATFRASGEFVGWYCNVTHPTTVSEAEREIRWHDLYVDVLVLPDGIVIVVDEDELADSDLADTDPALHATILAARDELLEMIQTNAYPFSEVRSAV